ESILYIVITPMIASSVWHVSHDIKQKIYVFLHSSFRSRDFKVVLIRIVEID
ncbi:hypothetical protein A5794_002363, partial [Enterococcus faecium]